MASAAQLHKMAPFAGFEGMLLEFLGNPTPYMPPSRLQWSRRLNRPVMDPEDEEGVFEAWVLRGELIRFGTVEIQYMWRRNENALPTVARGPARAAPRHAWCVAVLSTHQDGDFFEAWRRTHNAEWPRVRTPLPSTGRMTVSVERAHPQLADHVGNYLQFADAWNAVEACYIGPPHVDALSQLLGRSTVLNVQRDRALQQLRDMVRAEGLSFAWAI